MATLQVKDILTKTTQFLRDKGAESARLETELLISAALNWDRMKLYLNYDYPLSEAEVSACRENVRRRAAGEPVAYILGRKDFYNHSFVVNPAVLIPRPETETLVDETLSWIKLQNLEAPRIVDLGTGSGCVGLSLLAELPQASLLAVDLSADAIEVARKNAENLGLVERVTFAAKDVSDMTSTEASDVFGGLADAVVANPPYIAENDPEVAKDVKRYEPSSALFSQENGLAHIRAWSVKATELARPGAWVMFEIGYQQGRSAREIFESSGSYSSVRIVKDLSGRDRFVPGLKKEEI